MIENSFFCRLISQIAEWLSIQFGESRIINAFITQNDSAEVSYTSLFGRFYRRIMYIFYNLFRVFHIKQILKGSIFKIPYLWAVLAVAGSPFLPTMLVLAIVIVSFGALFLSLICDGGKKLKYYCINKYIYIYAFVYIYATFTSVTRSGSLFGGLLTVCFMLFFIVITNIIDKKMQLHFMLILFVLGGVLVSLYGFYQFMFPAKFSGVWHDRDMFESIKFRVYSTFGNPNVLGEYFLLVIPISAAYMVTLKSKILKLIFAGATGIMFICLFVTYSRGCYLGIMFAAAIFLVLLDRRFIILGIIGLLLMPMVLPQTIINRFLSIGDMADSSTSYRVYIWLGTIAMLKDYWLCGIGPGTAAFNDVYPAYAFNGISAPHSHNLFLQIICDAGIVGIICFIAIIYQFYKASFSALSKETDKEARVFIIAGISAISGFMVQSFTDYTFYNYRVTILFWIVLGFGILFTKMSSLKEG